MVNKKSRRYPCIFCKEETIKTVHKWMCEFKKVYGRYFTYEDVIVRALECLPYQELEVANAYRKRELVLKHKKELTKKRKTKK